jgi:hypothetical protein
MLVNLPGVRREQIVGRHWVCLVSNVRTVHCLRGPASVILNPPVQVVEIALDAAP